MVGLPVGSEGDGKDLHEVERDAGECAEDEHQRGIEADPFAEFDFADDKGGNKEAGGGEEDIGELAAPGIGGDDGLTRDMGQGGKLGLLRAGGRHAVGGWIIGLRRSA